MGLEHSQQFDSIDTQILSLLSERAEIVMQVADFKRHHHMPVYVPEREASIITHLRTINPGPLPARRLSASTELSWRR